MKLLVAAVDPDPAGWSWCVPGELVAVDAFCDLVDDPNHDPAHDCLYSFLGIASGKATTLARVAEVDHTRAQLLAVVEDSYTLAGMEVTAEELNAEADDLLADAADWPVGTLLKRYKDDLVPV